MVSLDKAMVAYYSHAGKRFEILVDPNLAQMYKSGQKKDLNNILVVEEIYSDAKKGERHKKKDLEEVFLTTDVLEIADMILKKGELALTTEQKRKKMEALRKKIITIISRETIDPRTGAPHTAYRIETALEKAKVHLDITKDAESQIDKVIKALRPIIPLKFEKSRIAIKIPAEYAQRAYGAVRSFGIKKEEWTSKGDLIVVIEIPTGMQGEIYEKLGKITNGTLETKVISKL